MIPKSKVPGSRSTSAVGNYPRVQGAQVVDETEQELLNMALDNLACDAVVVEIVKMVCDAAAEQIAEHHVEKQGVPFTVQNAVRDLKRLCRVSFIPRETELGERCVDGNFYNHHGGDHKRDGQHDSESCSLSSRGSKSPKNAVKKQNSPHRPQMSPTKSKNLHQPVQGATLGGQRWDSEAEPRPAVIDVWARGAVPLKSRFSAFDDAMSAIGKKSTSSFTQSEADKKSIRSGSKFSGLARRHGGFEKSKGYLPTTQEHDNKEVIVIELSAGEDDARRRLNPGISFGNSKFAGGEGFDDDGALDKYMQEVKNLEELKKQQERQRLQLEQEEQALMLLHEKTAKDLKGKSFFFEPDGRLVVIKQVKGEALTQMNYSLPVQVTDVQVHEEDGFENSAHSTMRSRKSTADDAHAGKGKGTRASIAGTRVSVSADGKPGNRRSISGVRGKAGQRKMSGYFQISPSVQPSLLSSVRLAAGVSMNENGSVVSGPNYIDDPTKMSRKEYTLRHALPQGAAGRTGTGPQHPLGATSAQMNSMSSAPVKSLRLSIDAGKSVSGAESMLTDPTAFLAYQESLPTNRSALPGEEHSQSTIIRLRSPPHTGRTEGTKGAYNRSVPDTDEDPHLKLIRSPIWGQNYIGEPNPPVRPKKTRPAAPDLYTKKTRDRMHPDIVTFTSNKKKLSAPPLGVTTGHGMSPLFDRLTQKSLRETNNMSRTQLFPPVNGATPKPSANTGLGSTLGSSFPLQEEMARNAMDLARNQSFKLNKSGTEKIILDNSHLLFD